MLPWLLTCCILVLDPVSDDQQMEQPRIHPSSQSQAESSMDNILSGELDFSDIVIKQEIEDESMTTDKGEDDSSTGENFERTRHSLRDPDDHQASDVQDVGVPLSARVTVEGVHIVTGHSTVRGRKGTSRY